MTNKQKIDWVAVGRDYRSGSQSVREIARWHQISEGAIRKHARAEGWERGTAAAVSTARAIIVRQAPTQPDDADARTVISRARNLTLRMLEELEAVTAHRDELLDCIDRETEGDADGARRTALYKALDLPTRAATLKSLALAFKTFGDALAPAGKKAQAEEDAKAAGEGTFWGDDLLSPRNGGGVN